MTQIFEHTDSDGDSVEVHKNQGLEGEFLSVTAVSGVRTTAYMDRSAVRRLHTVLSMWLADPVHGVVPEDDDQCPGLDALSARILRLETDARCSADETEDKEAAEEHGEITSLLSGIRDQIRIDEAEEAVTNALGAVSGVIKDEHQVDRQHYTSQFDTVVDRISDTYAMLHGLLTEIRDRLPEPAPKVCGVPDFPGGSTCMRELGHEGRHADTYSSWPVGIQKNVCGDTNPNGGQTCERSPHHLGYHRNVKESMDLERFDAREWRR